MIALSWIKKRMVFTESWLHTFLIGSILGAILVSILIFLQPFDTYEYESPVKNLELVGYGPLILFVVLLLHPMELWLFRKQGERWVYWKELLFICLGSFLMLIVTYFYNSLVINKLSVSLAYWWNWTRAFGSPFLVFLTPVWIYLRLRFGVKRPYGSVDAPVIISGQNKSEQLQIRAEDFLYAQSQQNYADIYYQKEGSDAVEKEMLRITLAELAEQLPGAQRVHRSYLVNIKAIEAIDGNARKRFLTLKNISDPIPLSQKYYASVQKKVSDSSQ